MAGPQEANAPHVTDDAPNHDAADQDAADHDQRSAARRRVGVTLWLIGAAGVLVAITALIGSRPEPAGTAAGWAGTVLESAEPKPATVLWDTEGRPVDLAADTDAPLTLLMFGYTNCPDICPISLATLASSLDSMGPEIANKVTMYFVTADPARDTPEVLRKYLDGFDPRFVGLTGTIEEIDRAQELANVPPALRDEPDEDGSYSVGHATQMIAYQADGTARIVYPFGTREGDWTSDIPRLVAGERPAI